MPRAEMLRISKQIRDALEDLILRNKPPKEGINDYMEVVGYALLDLAAGMLFTANISNKAIHSNVDLTLSQLETKYLLEGNSNESGKN